MTKLTEVALLKSSLGNYPNMGGRQSLARLALSVAKTCLVQTIGPPCEDGRSTDWPEGQLASCTFVGQRTSIGSPHGQVPARTPKKLDWPEGEGLDYLRGLSP